MKLHTVQARGNPPVREYPGTVSATEKATLSFKAPGTLVEFPVQNGEQVRKGQLLARIDTQGVQSRLAAAQAQKNTAESAYERAKRLYAEGIVSLQQLESRRQQYEVAQSKVTRAREALTDTRITAPFDGRVANTHVELNETVGPQTPIVTVQSLDRLEVVVDVPAQDQLRRTFEEASLRVSLPMLEGQSFPATLREITTTAARATRTYEATLTFAPPREADVLPGMSARAMVGGATNASPEAPLVIPISAVFSAPDGTSNVWVVDSTMTVTPRPVTLGTPHDSTVVVKSGLQIGDRIAATGVQQLQEGQTVRSLTP